MNEHTLISVIVPVYNAERFLGECIESILSQDYANLELILVDDGSKDNSYNICSAYAEKDARIRVYHNENHGVSYTRNFGMDVAKGTYISFIDSDDKISSDYLSTLYSELQEANGDLIFCGWQFLYGENIVKKNPRIKAGVYTFEELSYRAIDDGTLSGILFGSACSALYKSKLIKDHGISFDPSIKRNEDGLFNLQLLPYAQKVVVSSGNGYFYRQWKASSKKANNLVVSDELLHVSNVIKERCPQYANVEKQLRCREISILFWNAQKVKNVDMPITKLAKKLEAYLSKTHLREFYTDLNFSSLNRYKKALIRLLYKKQYVLFIFFIKYVKPKLEKRLRH